MNQEEFQQEVLKRFDRLDQKVDCLRDEMNGKFASLTLNLIRSDVLKEEVLEGHA